MSDAATELWGKALPDIRKAVTGVGIWAALNAARPITIEENVLVLGVPNEASELGGHLRMPSTKRSIELELTRYATVPFSVRVIDGITLEDLETVKRKETEARRLQNQAMEKMRAELSARTSWESVYEQLSRRYAAIQNKSLPQNRARFYEEAVELIADARRSQTWDELGERNFARCLERLSQYTELPTTLIAVTVLQRAGEL